MKLQFTAATEILLSSATTVTIPEKVVQVPARTKTVTSIEIISMLDEPSKKRVTVKIKELGTLILWEGTEYENIGQWTDNDVLNKIKDIYNIK